MSAIYTVLCEASGSLRIFLFGKPSLCVTPPALRMASCTTLTLARLFIIPTLLATYQPPNRRLTPPTALLLRAHQTNLKVREHKVLGPYVEGLRSFATKDFGAMNALILEGIKSRMTASTAMNDQSSRSHAVFNIQLTASTFDTMSGNTGEKTSRISLVDLAGSERVRCCSFLPTIVAASAHHPHTTHYVVTCTDQHPAFAFLYCCIPITIHSLPRDCHNHRNKPVQTTPTQGAHCLHLL